MANTEKVNVDKFRDTQEDIKKGDTFTLLGKPGEKFDSSTLPDEDLDAILADSDRPTPDADS